MIGIVYHRNYQIAIIQRNSNTDIDMFLEKNIISVNRYIDLRICCQCFCNSFCYDRHIGQFHSLTAEESVFILFTPAYQFGYVYLYYIGYVW